MAGLKKSSRAVTKKTPDTCAKIYIFFLQKETRGKKREKNVTIVMTMSNKVKYVPRLAPGELPLDLLVHQVEIIYDLGGPLAPPLWSLCGTETVRIFSNLASFGIHHNILN